MERAKIKHVGIVKDGCFMGWYFEGGDYPFMDIATPDLMSGWPMSELAEMAAAYDGPISPLLGPKYR